MDALSKTRFREFRDEYHHPTVCDFRRTISEVDGKGALIYIISMHMIKLARTLILVFVAIFSSLSLQAADLPDSRDPQFLKRFGGSEIVGYDVKRFEEYELQTSTFKKMNLATHRREYIQPALKVEGALTRIWYEAAGSTSSTELARNYVEELKAQGFDILYDSGKDPAAKDWSNFCVPFDDDNRRTSRSYYVFLSAGTNNLHTISAKLTRPQGDVYVSVITVQWDKDDATFHAKRGAYAAVDIIEVQAMKQNMVAVSADEMSRAIASAGRVALYGIFFDTDKAEILPKSKGALDEIAKLLTKERGLKLRVVGHTDGVGGMEQNLTLSKKRADAVVAALTKEHGIDVHRLSAHGVASLAPTATNAIEEGRAKNRRVELVPW
ncbi:MAG: OmpA family protein [Fibrobacteria bacterium]